MKKVLLSLINIFFLTTHGKQFKIYSFTLFIVSGSFIFTTVPETQYVYVNDTVTFECATNASEYTNSLMIDTNPTLGGLPLFISYLKVFITLTATSEINGTSFTCRALHVVATTERAYLYVQGQYNIDYNELTVLKHSFSMYSLYLYTICIS